MQNCVQRVISVLREQKQQDMQERLLEAGLLIEKSRGLSSYRGISSVVDEANFTSGEIEELRLALIHFLEDNREHPDVGSALFALGRFQDKALKSFFLKK
jgi:hypothetical protein